MHVLQNVRTVKKVLLIRYLDEFRGGKRISAMKILNFFCYLVFCRCEASAGSGRSAGGKRFPASGRDHGQRGDVIRRRPVVLRQPLQ